MLRQPVKLCGMENTRICHGAGWLSGDAGAAAGGINGDGSRLARGAKMVDSLADDGWSSHLKLGKLL
jgi:hypothetical protein